MSAVLSQLLRHVGAVAAPGLAATAPRHEICRSQHRESRRGIDIAHRPPTERVCVRVEDLLVGGMGWRKPIPVWGWSVGDRRSGHPCVPIRRTPAHCWAQSVSEPA